ncbi:MAG: hypothetical protein OXB88_04220 [Bacteriovoracales bacterium]|nr:hypothetical protein [Bacteriovoracales bacterium]
MKVSVDSLIFKSFFDFFGKPWAFFHFDPIEAASDPFDIGVHTKGPLVSSHGRQGRGGIITDARDLDKLFIGPGDLSPRVFDHKLSGL